MNDATRNIAYEAAKTAALLMTQGDRFELSHDDGIATVRFEDGMTLTVERHGDIARIVWAVEYCEPHLISTADYELGAILRRVATDLI